MAGNGNLHMSRNDKADEFYTQLSLIENELRHYRDFFKGKTVLCNCDDPFESNFFKYFALNFNALGLRKLICTFTDNQKRIAYEQQNGICVHCGQHFEIEQMDGDHITPWRDGGKTVQENCQMLCRHCNRSHQ